VLVADFGSVLTSVAVPLAAEHHMLLIDPTGSGANFFTKPTNYLADVSIPSSTVWPRPLANYLLQQKIKRVAIIYDANDFDASQAGTLKEVLAKGGVTPVYDHGVPTSESNYTVLLHTIAASHPDAVLEFGYPPNDIAFLRALSQSGLHFPMTFTIFPGQLLSLLTKNVGEKALAYTYTYPTPPLVKYAKVSYGMNTADFVKAFAAAKNKQPNFLDCAGYNTGLIIQHMMDMAPKFTQWFLPENTRRRCSRCAMPCTGSTARSRCPSRTRSHWTQGKASRSTSGAGEARAQAGQTQGAVADMRRVIAELRASGKREKTRDALIQLGMAYRRADQYEAASACLNEALMESLAMNDEHHAADTLYHLGTVVWSTGRNDQAIRFHQQAVEICERTACADLVAVQAFHGRGEAHYANAEPEAAIACYTRSIELARGIGDKSYESENLMMVGHACLGTKGLGDYPRAMANFEAALGIARAADLQWHFGPTLLGLDHARACTGGYGEAWGGMQKTLCWLESLKQTRYQFIAYDCIGHLLLDLGLNEQAVEQLERGIALGHDTGNMYWRAAIDTHLAVARSRLGQKDVLRRCRSRSNKRAAPRSAT